LNLHHKINFMKKIFLLILSLYFSQILFSQPWLKNLPQNKSKKDLSFFDYKNAFEQYWAPFNVDKGYYTDNGVKTKAAGWKQFKRWEYTMEGQVNPVTGEFPKKTAREVYEEYVNANPRSDQSTTSNWTCLGTSSSTGGYAGIGRVNCIAFHPTNNNTYWIGAASGGLWVTTNNGSTWTCLTDNNGVLAVSDIVIPTDYATSNIIYIATGDKDHWDNRSIGVLKSTNGGATWNSTGLSYALSDGKMVNRLLLDPSNNQNIIAATTSGVYKTTNGGTTWSTQLSSTTFISLEYKPGDFNTLYGSTQTGKIYVTSNGGGLWTLTFSNANAYRIQLAVSANQPAWVYALADNSVYGLYGVYQSTNNGASFSQVLAGTTLNLLGWNSNGGDAGGQGFYDLSLAASPSNANLLLVGGVNTWRSINGGTSWSIVNHWSGSGAQAVHADKHCLSFRSNGDLFECNDGGTYISTNTGTSWTDKTNGLVISQMYKLSVSQTSSGEIITGLQDNGTKLLYGGTWHDVYGGDGMECLIDYTNTSVQYATYVNGEIHRTLNHWSSNSNVSPSGAGTGAWVTPYIIHPTNSLTLYAGYADVWKTTNQGTSWTKISTMNTSNKIRSMAIAPSNTQFLYVADPSVIWKTTDGGTSWTNITGNLPAGSITYIAVKNDDANTLWVTLGGYNANTVFQSTVGGTTWTNISAGLPQLPAWTIVQNKQSTTEFQLYVGTELGIYFKKGSANWVAFNTGLPDVKIGEIEIFYATNPRDSKLRAATYGRGLWESPVYYDCGTLPVPTIAGLASVCAGTSGVSYTTEAGMTGYSWTISAGGTFIAGSGPNQILATWNTAGAQTVSVNYANVYFCSAASPTVKNVTVDQIPAQPGIISGTTPVCQGSTNTYSISAVPGASSYVWTLPSGWSGSSTSTSINGTAGSGGGTITVKANNSCGPGPAQSKSITVNPLPAQPSSISGPSHVCQGATNTYSISAVSGAASYTWNLPSGWSGTSASTSINATASTVSGNISVSANNSCGPGPAQSMLLSVFLVPVQISVINTNILNGQNNCNNASQTITVAGNTSTFWVQNGGSATMIAGQNIDYLPGTTVYSGGYMHGYITSNSCCGILPLAPALVINQTNNENLELIPLTIAGSTYLRVYPNPTTGTFILELNGDFTSAKTNVEIYGMRGEKVMTTTLSGEWKHEFSLSDRTAGIYFIRVMSGNKAGSAKIIKQ
jgi:photosystem II stability/assembly factor-like uncharacterized protein